MTDSGRNNRQVCDESHGARQPSLRPGVMLPLPQQHSTSRSSIVRPADFVVFVTHFSGKLPFVCHTLFAREAGSGGVYGNNKLLGGGMNLEVGLFLSLVASSLTRLFVVSSPALLF